ncbi:hypothetical protein ACFOD4_04505 [Pseudoroseomonas globiformis]|uniref:CopG family transcriptional regulator n=1 Tax=Teichococcus globiformis TaxID=2307229 RepID=A0ABV7FYE6_9PROT
MQHQITITLPDDAVQHLKRVAVEKGSTLEEIAAQIVDTVAPSLTIDLPPLPPTITYEKMVAMREKIVCEVIASLDAKRGT